ncbi:MAG: tryptophan synthase subunit alpha [Spirochaetia bacterium]|jgi:tryptophan synthase alpha chain|nr:tryptophan synthase subunit alpha [Spirochaetia bacterium]
MNRIHTAFGKGAERPSGKSFIGFATGGDPDLERSEAYILEMVRAGADLVEIGIPFSDPIAEGPVIQEANIRALKSGATVKKIFALVESLRENLKSRLPSRAGVPIVFLSYLNPVFSFGYDAFFRRCAQTGVDGIIIPDLPFEEQAEVKGAALTQGVDLISLIAPTSGARIRRIAEAATGFIYLVSSLGVTGIRSEIKTDLASIIAEVKAVTAVPTAVGFGIHTPAQASEIAGLADGVIVGSAIVKIIAAHPTGAGPFIAEYVREMKTAIGGKGNQVGGEDEVTDNR